MLLGSKSILTPLIPVSYTHLDVYKRQVQDQMKWVRLMNNIKASAEEIVLKNLVCV